jgi:hypothetical protein
LDENGRLFDIQKDRGQYADVADEFPLVAKQLRDATADFRDAMTKEFARYANRPFTVGYARSTTLPARDGIPHGTIQRSSKAPNNSFFVNWTRESDSITWDIDVGAAGEFEAIVHYTCKQSDVGARIRLGVDRGEFTEAAVTEAFDPPLYDKSKERVADSHYFVKDFRPLPLGVLSLEKGRAVLRLTAPEITGTEAIDVHSVELNRVQ